MNLGQFRMTEKDLKEKHIPELLVLTKDVRVKEHNADFATGRKAGWEVFVSGDDKLTLLLEGSAVRKSDNESEQEKTNT